MANFLKLKGSAWGGENAWCGVQPEEKQVTANELEQAGTTVKQPKKGGPTILETIYAQRKLDVEASSSTLATTQANLTASLALHTAPPQIDFVKRLKATSHTAVMAEIKRASPSKGDIASTASAPAQALRYALAGASVISVLTEPKWFKGNLIDMLAVRQALDSIPNRPAILRKDFVMSKYQIDEARLYGADTVLLIVAMLEPTLLKELYDYSLSLGMEPLVEVNNPDELKLAIEIGSKVVGVNNRNLHDFQVDMSTTSRVNAALDGRDITLCALSGIASRDDVAKYEKEGVRAVLVGESLMRAENPAEFLRHLAGIPTAPPTRRAKPLVKICGIRTAKDAQLAIDAGADMLGIILVPGTKRRVDTNTARDIANVVRGARHAFSSSSASTGLASVVESARQVLSSPFTSSDQAQSTPTGLASANSSQNSTLPWFTFQSSRLLRRRKPLLVGVFQNQPLEEILDLVDEIGLDLVQLHGDESQSMAKFIPVPVIKCFKVSSTGTITGGQVDRPGNNALILLDAAGSGGEGKTFPWRAAKDIVNKGEVGTNGAYPLPIILAGGLGPENVAKAIEEGGLGVWAVDVSSGVEGADGFKDERKVRAFVSSAKSA